MKIRIFALAKELNLDSKDLIQACTEVGLNVKNSPLASISPEERDSVLAHMKSRSKSAPAKAIDTATIPREPAPERVKAKPIRNLAGAKGKRQEDEQDAEDDVEAEVPVEPEVIEVEAPEVVAEDEVPPTPEPIIEPTVSVEAVAEPVALPEAVSSPPPAKPQSVAPVATPAAPAPAGPKKPSPLTRSDYVTPGGGMREMKPVGSVRESQPRPGQAARGAAAPPITRDKGSRNKPALPAMVVPNFKTPAPTKVEGPTQKPDFKLTGEMIRDPNKGKIAEIMRKNKEVGTKKPGQVTPLTAEELRNKAKGAIGGMEEIREARRQKRTRRPGDDDVQVISRKQKHGQRKAQSTELKSSATITLPLTMRGFSEALGRPAGKLIGIAMKAGKMASINDPIDEEMALEIAMELGIDLKIEYEADVETELRAWLDRPNDDFGVPLVERPPIITILGHVDHGKTTLVDKIRSSNVAAGEAGGITQHIAAYQVEHQGKRLTFLDTPGHAAFSAMRSRGANTTDIVVLVVAANDGVMPQTVECIAHAKAAGVPIVVALNKIDLPGINEQKVLTELSQQGLYPTEWGGDVEVVRISALNGTGIDKLLETLLLTAELTNYTAPADIAADGICLEAFRDEGRGPMAWCIVRRGTLRIGDTILCGATYGHVRAMYNDKGKEVKEAGPSTPVKIAGLTDVPGAGQHFFAVDDLDMAVEVAKERKDKGRADMLARRGGTRTLEEFFAHRDGTLRELPVIIKADMQGSIEAIRHELDKLEHPEVRIRILHEAVGGVNESDVYLAASSGAIIVAFHIAPDENAINLASQEEVEIRRYTIIYNVADDIRQALEGLLSPEVVTVQTGRALVLRTFSNSKVGTIAGCRVLSGLIERSSRVNVIRDQKILNDYGIGSLRREKEDVREVRDGLECGIKLEGFNDIKEGDLLECFRIEHRKRKLEI